MSRLSQAVRDQTEIVSRNASDRIADEGRMPWLVYAIPLTLFVIVAVYAIVASWIPGT
jgi:hypothetical protein